MAELIGHHCVGPGCANKLGKALPGNVGREQRWKFVFGLLSAQWRRVAATDLAQRRIGRETLHHSC